MESQASTIPESFFSTTNLESSVGMIGSPKAVQEAGGFVNLAIDGGVQYSTCCSCGERRQNAHSHHCCYCPSEQAVDTYTGKEAGIRDLCNDTEVATTKLLTFYSNRTSVHIHNCTSRQRERVHPNATICPLACHDGHMTL
jgi:hypothetical protein